MKKIFFVLAVSFTILPFTVRAATYTPEQFQALINSILAQIQTLQAQINQMRQQQGGSAAWCHNFSKNIGAGEKTCAGNTDIEVASLEEALAREGLITRHAGDCITYDSLVSKAVTAFQEKYRSQVLTPSGLKKGTGFTGPATRAMLNRLYGCISGKCPSYWAYTSDNLTCRQIELCGNISVCPSGASCDPIPGGNLTYAFNNQTDCQTALGNRNNRSPSISSVSGPSVLTVNQQGTWTISASDPEGGVLSYFADWGESGSSLAAPSTYVQTAAFAHSYATTGAYTVKFWVRDSAGNTSQSSLTVSVGAASANNISAPRLGDVWTAGNSYTVIWNSSIFGSDLPTITLLNESDGKTCVYNNVSNTGSYNFAVPSGTGSGTCVGPFNTGSRYEIIVSTAKATLVSEAFTLNNNTGSNITAPVSGTTWIKGQTYTVSWNASAFGSTNPTVTLVNNTDNKSCAYEGVPNTGSFSFFVPTGTAAGTGACAGPIMPGSNYQIKITGSSTTLTSGIFSVCQ